MSHTFNLTIANKSPLLKHFMPRLLSIALSVSAGFAHVAYSAAAVGPMPTKGSESPKQPLASVSALKNTAQPWIVKIGPQAEFDWSEFALRSTSTPLGYASASNGGNTANQVNYINAEKSAWSSAKNEALANASAFLRQDRIHSKLSSQPLSNTQLKELRKELFRRDSIFFTNGTISMVLEADLKKYLRDINPTSKLSEESSDVLAAASPYTGIIFTGELLSPVSHYVVADDLGSALFQAEDMQPKAYQKQLMGRWFLQAKRSQLSAFVGNNPLILKTKQIDNQLRVSQNIWSGSNQAARKLLQNGRVALVKSLE